MKKVVVFDFDGVLAESLDLWFRINQSNNPGLTKEEYSAMSHGSYIDAFENKKLVSTDAGLEEYRRELLKIETPNSIVSFIKNNSEKYIFAIVSSGNEVTIKSFLVKEGIENKFSTILGYESHKSKTVKLTDLSSMYGVATKDTVFVTDTLGDVMEAHQAGVKSIGVLWGLHDRTTLERGKPEVIIDDPSQLEETVERVLNG
jgi:phosphoglycolate phosphatase